MADRKRAAAAPNHPAMGRLFAIDSRDSSPSLVLERLEGESLGEMLAEGPIPA